ncbi:MAG: branched-chain amino acid ABC transporter permease [Desulfatiglans sp.]|nr:branched-chain amino acid ABC transporter permease [Desulfatiglans sp.]
MSKVAEVISRIREISLIQRFDRMEKKPKKITITVLCGFSLFLPSIFSGYFVSIAIVVLLYTLVSAGIFLLIGYAGILSLGQGGFFCIGAYVSALLSIHFHLPAWLSLVCAAIVSSGFAYILGRPFLVESSRMSVAIITLAFSIIIWITVSRLPFTGGHDGLVGISSFQIGKLLFDDRLCYYLAWITAGVVLLFTYNITEKRFGRGLRAMNEFSGGDEIATITSGVDTTKLKLQIFILASIYASVAGSIFAHWMTVVSPGFFDVMVSVILVMITGIGGFRSVWGPLVGSGFYWGLKEVLGGVFARQAVLGVEPVVFGIVFLLVWIFLPGGLTGMPDEAREWWHNWQVWRGKKIIMSHEEWLK